MVGSWVSARHSRWKDEGPLGSYCNFEGRRRFPHFGINISVLEPGERIGMYHREKGQEAFLVLAGECTLIVEGEERRLVAWDFFYCAPETEHIIVAAGQQSAVVLAVGARGRGVGGGVVYTVCKAAARYGASVARETTQPAIAYAKVYAGTPEVQVRQIPARLAAQDRLRRRALSWHPRQLSEGSGGIVASRASGPPWRWSTALQSRSGSSLKTSSGSAATTIQLSSSSSASIWPADQPA